MPCLALALALVALLVLTNGCSGGGGGRQVLPGENPFEPQIPIPGTGTGTATGTTPVPSKPLTPAELLAAGWLDMSY